MQPAVHLDAALHDELVRALRARAPREFVGLLAGEGAAAATLVRHFEELPNVAAGDDAFAVDPLAFAAAEARLRRRGQRWLGFVHSHPRAPAVPSAADLFALWHHCLQLVVGRSAAGVEVRAFRLTATGCTELPVVVVAATGVR